MHCRAVQKDFYHIISLENTVKQEMTRHVINREKFMGARMEFLFERSTR